MNLERLIWLLRVFFPLGEQDSCHCRLITKHKYNDNQRNVHVTYLWRTSSMCWHCLQSRMTDSESAQPPITISYVSLLSNPFVLDRAIWASLHACASKYILLYNYVKQKITEVWLHVDFPWQQRFLWIRIASCQMFQLYQRCFDTFTVYSIMYNYSVLHHQQILPEWFLHLCKDKVYIYIYHRLLEFSLLFFYWGYYEGAFKSNRGGRVQTLWVYVLLQKSTANLTWQTLSW